MPSYEFKCKKCGETFSFQTSISDYEKRKLFTCLKRNSKSVPRIFSRFTAVTSKKS